MSEPAATSAVLFSVHKHLQAKCAAHSAAYLACKKKNQDPAACLEEGSKVTGCMLDLYAPVLTRNNPRSSSGLLSPGVTHNLGFLFHLCQPPLAGGCCGVI